MSILSKLCGCTKANHEQRPIDPPLKPPVILSALEAIEQSHSGERDPREYKLNSSNDSHDLRGEIHLPLGPPVRTQQQIQTEEAEIAAQINNLDLRKALGLQAPLQLGPFEPDEEHLRVAEDSYGTIEEPPYLAPVPLRSVSAGSIGPIFPGAVVIPVIGNIDRNNLGRIYSEIKEHLLEKIPFEKEKSIFLAAAMNRKAPKDERHMASLELDRVQMKLDKLNTELDILGRELNELSKSAPVLIEDGYKCTPWRELQFREMDLGMAEAEIDYQIQCSINSLANFHDYCESLHHVINRNKSLLLREFSGVHLDPINSKHKKRLDKIQVTVEKIADETHNRGKFAVLVRFTEKQRLGQPPLAPIVLKPRTGIYERSLTKLFDTINKLPEGDKSLNTYLPVYKVIDLQDVEEFSAHEYIKGTPLGAGSIGYVLNESRNGIRLKTFDENSSKVLLTNQADLDMAATHAKRLEQVLRSALVGDLHGNNTLYCERGKITPQVNAKHYYVPIDTEVRGNQWMQFPTLILSKLEAFEIAKIGMDNIPKLSLKEEALVNQLNDSFKGIPVRALPAATGQFTSMLGEREAAQRIAEMILENLSRDPSIWTLEPINVILLSNVILTSVIEGDVPAFDLIDNSLYIRAIKDKKVVHVKIATKKGDSQ